MERERVAKYRVSEGIGHSDSPAWKIRVLGHGVSHLQDMPQEMKRTTGLSGVATVALPARLANGQSMEFVRYAPWLKPVVVHMLMPPTDGRAFRVSDGKIEPFSGFNRASETNRLFPASRLLEGRTCE